VIIVNEAFVRKFLGGREPVGATVDVEMGRGAASTRTIVGVVGDSTYRSLRLADAPIEYVPLTQFPAMTLMPTLAISVRATSDSPMLLTRRVTAALTGVDPDLMFSFRLLTEQVGATLVQERLVATLSGFFGALALLLAGLGLYGVTAYAVVQRRMELGIRMALGSTSTGIVQLVLSRLAVQVGAGIAIGISVSLWASRFIASLLYGLAPRDPGTLVGAVVVLVSVVVIAGWLPAYRASRIDPARVLRES
jgi:ABC-type antimicrobial peptide transport system permease subunit